MSLSSIIISLLAIAFPCCFVTPSWDKLTRKNVTRLLSVIFCLEGLTNTPFHDDCNHYEMPYVWEKTPSYAPTPGFLDREYTPSIICPLPDPDDINDERSSSLHEYPSDQQVGGRDGNAWDEQSSDCIHYQIEWKVKLNN